jgi:hypothetical protein
MRAGKKGLKVKKINRIKNISLTNNCNKLRVWLSLEMILSLNISLAGVALNKYFGNAIK